VRRELHRRDLAGLYVEGDVVALDLRRVHGAVHAEDLERHLVTLDDGDPARQPAVGLDRPGPLLIGALEPVAASSRARLRREGGLIRRHTSDARTWPQGPE